MVARKSSWDFLHVSKGLKVMSWDQRFFDSIESPVSSPNLRLNFCRFCLIAGPYCRCFIRSPRGISLNLSDLGHVPATAIIAEPFPSALRDRDGVLEFDEPALRMQDRGFDRDHHAALERQVLVGGRLGHHALARQMRSLMTDKPHAVGEKVEMRQLLRALHGLFPRRIDVAAAPPPPPIGFSAPRRNAPRPLGESPDAEA